LALARQGQEQRADRRRGENYRGPQTNGKIERFQRTTAREWAYGLTYAQALTAPTPS
jgi:hypothetical protein